MVKNNNKKNNGTNALRGLLAFLVALAVFLGVELIPQLTENLGTDNHPSYTEASDIYEGSYESRLSLDDIVPFEGEPYIVVNGNVPFFTEVDMTTEPFELFSELDDLGRCGTAYANVCQELMPTEERGAIGSVKPSGWHLNKYDCVDGKYLYNRCHLLGYQLTGENANVKNLITGTRYLNVTGMLPFENEIADYADIRKKADADKYAAEKKAEAELYARKQEAEAKRFEQEQIAEGIKAVGAAEAEAIKAKALAEAEGIDRKAEAMKKYGEAAVVEMIMNALPEIAKNVATPLSNVDSITMYGEGNSTKLIEDIVSSTTQVSNGMLNGLGIDLRSLLAGFVGGKVAVPASAPSVEHTAVTEGEAE